MLSGSNQLKKEIKKIACNLGFEFCGITLPIIKNYKSNLKEAIQSKRIAKLTYLERNIEKRLNPKLLVPYTKSIIVCAINYYTKKTTKHFSRYAQGTDYHLVVKNRLKDLANEIDSLVPNFKYKIFCDTAPILEKALAEQAGIGWIGKNSLLITKKGSFFFLGELFTNLDLEPDESSKNYCGKCSKCIDICPTKAIVSAQKVNIKNCLSYLTTTPYELYTNKNIKKYGCDICQDICPWSKFAEETNIKELKPNQFSQMNMNELRVITETDFKNKTKKMSIGYIGFNKFKTIQNK